MEEEQLQPTPEPTQEPVPEQDNETTSFPDSQEKNENAGITPTPESPENTGFSEDGNDENGSGIDNNTSENEIQQDEEQDPETEEDGDGSTTNITIIRPPAQIAYTVNADTEATYHVTVDNETDAPVPVLVTETLIEPDPGIMEKKLEDYTVTEGLLLLILITLWLRIIFDYFGRRRT